MSVKKKLIIYNSIIIFCLAFLTVAISIYSSKNIIGGDIKEYLIQAVSKNADNLYTSDGFIYVDDSFNFYSGNIYLCILSKDGEFINGVLPEGTYNLVPILKGVVRNVLINNNEYYIYDYEIELLGRENIFLRGITSTKSNAINSIIIITIFSAIVLVVLSVVISMLISKKTIKPYSDLQTSIEGIESSGDLTKRLSENTSDKDINNLYSAYNKMLERLNDLFKNEERFTSDVSHELRTPLTVILSEAEFSLNEAKSDEEKDASLNVILRQTKKLVTITNSLLEFSRIANKNQIEKQLFNASETTLNFINDYISSKNIKILGDIQNDINIVANEVMFVRILQNLTDNSIKYGKDNGNILITLKKNLNNVVLSVKDDGIGMDEETKKHVFDRFFQAEKSRGNKQSLGLGLSFVKEMVRLNGASINLISYLDKGTEFIITFKN